MNAMEKKGMIELNFNWVFILIAGAVIFVFFVSIANKQKAFSELKSSGTIITSLESILTGAQVSTNTVNVVDMPKADIGFECSRYFIGSIPKQTKGNVIFSPSLLKGKKMITWALDWNLPYRVTNFLYITDPELRYVVVDNDANDNSGNNYNGNSLGEKLYEELPREINKELVKRSKPGDLVDKNNYKVKFIFFDDENDANDGVNDAVLNKLREMPDEDVRAINIKVNSVAEIPPTGTIEFLKKDSSASQPKWKLEGTAYYLKKESLFGAVFAEDLQTYGCVMKKAFKKLALVTGIYLKRSSGLEEYYGPDGINRFYCKNAHSIAATELEEIKNKAEELSKKEIRGSLTLTVPQDIKDDIDGIMDSSERIGGAPCSTNPAGEFECSANSLAQLHSCALVY